MDQTACNYNAGAEEEDGSCGKLDMCNTCLPNAEVNEDGSSDSCVQDCAGIWGGETPASVCSICESETVSNEYDCAGNCCENGFIYDTGSLIQTDTSCSVEDKCDKCGGDGWNDGLSCDDIYILQKIIDANDFSVQQSAQNETAFHTWDYNANGVIEFSEFGEQDWSDGGRLTNLMVDIPFILTDDIGQLTELRVLILKTNGLTEIPETIGNLQKLEILNIISNAIISLPDSIFGLTNLEELNISNNQISELPENIGNLTSLTNLDASQNDLITLPVSISTLSNLTHLFLANNQIDSLPSTFGDLPNLSELRLQYNQLVSLPDNFGAFATLLNLYLHKNKLDTLPESFGNMSNLQRLRLNDNNLNSLPTSIGYMESLEELWLQRNQIVVLPEEIGELGALVTIKIENNSLQAIPESIGNIVSLKNLYLDNNILFGLPQSLCDLNTDSETYYSGLETFSVSANNLCPGSYPICIPAAEIGSQTCQGCPPNYFMVEGYCAWEPDYDILQNFLDLNPTSQALPSNTGIPYNASECVNEDWWDGGRLVEISFIHKNLTSAIPENFGDLDRLEILRLTDNGLTGEIPDNMTNLNNLNVLKLNYNNLSGTIPQNIGALSDIDTLWLNDNDISGTIPFSITNLSKLQQLYLQNNHLSGAIPENIGAMDSLKWLFLDNNVLGCYDYDFECDPDGLLPECCTTHCDDTSECHGQIPQSIGDLINLIRLYLYNNFLSGQIPDSICNIFTINSDFWPYLNNNQLCPGLDESYPECISYPEDQIGHQDTTQCSDK